MNLQQERTALRTHLLDMSRLSQRALDYSIKGYKLNSCELSNHIAGVGCQIEERYCQIKVLSRQLIGTGVAAPSDFRFSLAALRLNSAFYKTYKAASRIARATAARVERGTAEKCAALDEFGELINRLVRLCIIALFLNDAVLAEAVLQSQAVWRRSELIFHHSPSDVDSYTLAITQNLAVIAKQAHEMADAILFWLRGRDCAQAIETQGHRALDHLIPKAGSAVGNNPEPAQLSAA